MSQAHILANKLQSQSGRVVVVVVWQDDLTALLSVKASAPHGLSGPRLRRCLICSMFSDSLLSAPRRPAPTTDHDGTVNDIPALFILLLWPFRFMAII